LIGGLLIERVKQLRLHPQREHPARHAPSVKRRHLVEPPYELVVLCPAMVALTACATEAARRLVDRVQIL
jgi:hypothetical protein